MLENYCISSRHHLVASPTFRAVVIIEHRHDALVLSAIAPQRDHASLIGPNHAVEEIIATDEEHQLTNSKLISNCLLFTFHENSR